MMDLTFTVENVGQITPPVDTWPAWRKHAVTRAIKVEGPFTVETSEGPLKCADGYLAVDARGYPYPIATDEFEMIYARVAGDVDPHPATAQLLRYFAFEHLPPRLAAVSRPFSDLAHQLATTTPGPEATVALRKLLEAKDCAVRAALDLHPV